MIELLSLQFFQNAFFASVILSVLFGVLSFFIVLRKMAFLGAGIAHTAFGGIALGILLGIHPFCTALFFCILSAILIGRLSKYGHVSYDVSIGIFFAFSMALGALFIAMKKSYSFDLMGYLFGNILAVSTLDVVMSLISLLIFIPFIFLFFHRILFMAIDKEVATISGVRTELLDTLLLIMLAGVIVVSIKIVGIILVSALVVLPASIGLAVSKNYLKVIFLGVIYTLLIMTGGLFLSYYLDAPAGATIVVSGTVIYLIVIILTGIFKNK